MKIQPAILKETAHIAVGTLAGAVIVAAVYAVSGHWALPVLAGCALGAVWSVLNFFLLGISVQLATATGDEKRAKLKLQLSYSLRLLGTFGVFVLAFSVDAIAWPPVIVLFFMPRLTIGVMQLLGMYRPEQGPREGSDA